MVSLHLRSTRVAEHRRRRADHHLPLRAWPCGSRRDHGGLWQALPQGDADQGRHRDGTTGRGRYGRLRQDRHPDHGCAASRGTGRSARGGAGRGPVAGHRFGPPAGRGAGARPARHGPPAGAVDRSARSARLWRRGPVERHARPPWPRHLGGGRSARRDRELPSDRGRGPPTPSPSTIPCAPVPPMP